MCINVGFFLRLGLFWIVGLSNPNFFWTGDGGARGRHTSEPERRNPGVLRGASRRDLRPLPYETSGRRAGGGSSGNYAALGAGSSGGGGGGVAANASNGAESGSGAVARVGGRRRSRGRHDGAPTAPTFRWRSSKSFKKNSATT